jgi:hypothetical protein
MAKRGGLTNLTSLPASRRTLITGRSSFGHGRSVGSSRIRLGYALDEARSGGRSHALGSTGRRKRLGHRVTLVKARSGGGSHTLGSRRSCRVALRRREGEDGAEEGEREDELGEAHVE